MPHTSISSKDVLRKVFKRISTLGRRSLVCCEPDDHSFLEAFILSSVCSSIHPFLQIILVLNLQCGKELNEFRTPNSSASFAFSSVFFSSKFYVVPQGSFNFKERLPKEKCLRCAHRKIILNMLCLQIFIVLCRKLSVRISLVLWVFLKLK